MKRLVLLTGIVTLMAGCAPFKEAHYLDREFGKDSRAAWDAQIINQDQRYAEEVPEGMAGIAAEETMKVRNQMLTEKPRKTKMFDFDIK